MVHENVEEAKTGDAASAGSDVERSLSAVASSRCVRVVSRVGANPDSTRIESLWTRPNLMLVDFSYWPNSEFGSAPAYIVQGKFEGARAETCRRLRVFTGPGDVDTGAAEPS
ncbi:hypothetical protein [Caballeronia glathei]|uniref:hypothetical protein n=1 Tax=Caballeronia glathei TaxID=60547 RepID=UPI000A6FB773|nr:MULTISPECIES: hypothetical protein [Burkholderiaceae]